MSAHTWAILTGEYPPESGGVSDYTHQVAGALARAGDNVHIFAPAPCASDQENVIVHALQDCFGAKSLRQISEVIDRLPRDTRILLQYVPHAFKQRAMNVGLCAWLASNSARWNIGVMFHEVAYPIASDQPVRHNVLGVVTRGMAMTIARSAKRIYVSIPAWEELLRPLITRDANVRWLAVPSNLPRCVDAQNVARIRKEHAPSEKHLIGHFGSHAVMLQPILRELQTRNFAFIECGRALSKDEAAAHIAACDLLVQPYPDGINTRRSSAMAALALGKPVVSAVGRFTEPLWKESDAAALASTNDHAAIARVVDRMLLDPDARERIARNGETLYDSRFDLRFTVEAIREDDWN